MPRGNIKNLRTPTPEQARINGAKGGKRSQEVQKQRKTIAESLRIALSIEAPKKVQTQLKKLGMDEQTTMQLAIAIAQVQQAAKGDTRAAAFVRDTIGEMPGQSIREEQLKLQKEKQAFEKQMAKERLKLQKEMEEFQRMIALEKIGMDKEKLKKLTVSDEEQEDDGFLDALKASASEVWNDDQETI